MSAEAVDKSLKVPADSARLENRVLFGLGNSDTRPLPPHHVRKHLGNAERLPFRGAVYHRTRFGDLLKLCVSVAHRLLIRRAELLHVPIQIRVRRRLPAHFGIDLLLSFDRGRGLLDLHRLVHFARREQPLLNDILPRGVLRFRESVDHGVGLLKIALRAVELHLRLSGLCGLLVPPGDGIDGIIPGSVGQPEELLFILKLQLCGLILGVREPGARLRLRVRYRRGGLPLELLGDVGRCLPHKELKLRGDLRRVLHQRLLELVNRLSVRRISRGLIVKRSENRRGRSAGLEHAIRPGRQIILVVLDAFLHEPSGPLLRLQCVGVRLLSRRGGVLGIRVRLSQRQHRAGAHLAFERRSGLQRGRQAAAVLPDVILNRLVLVQLLLHLLVLKETLPRLLRHIQVLRLLIL